MARYEFRCRTCDEVFEVERPMARSGDPAPCPRGHDETVRLLSAFASVGASSTPAPAPGPATPCGGACACYPE